MKNNKLSRKRADRARTQQFTKQADGTEVLHSREARIKQRRWTFEADIEVAFPDTKDAEGNDVPARVLPMRTLRLEPVSYGDAKAARHDCTQHLEYLKATNPMFQRSHVKIRAIPHETVSNETIRQIAGYRDMSFVLDRALELAVREAQDVVTGKSVGSQFVEVSAIEATDGNPGSPERTIASIKEEFYRTAAKELRPEVSNEQASVTATDAATEASEGEQGFVPEIVEVQRASANEANEATV